MAMQHLRESAEDTARRGDEIYEQQVRAKVEAGNQRKIVPIDTETGRYAVGDTALAASKRLLSQYPLPLPLGVLTFPALLARKDCAE